jgi:hypothetical protein
MQPLPTVADRIRLFGALDTALRGNLVIGNPNGLSKFADTNSWTLFDLSGGGSSSSAFAVDHSAPSLSPGLTATFNHSTAIFSITAAAVPEASRTTLLTLGLAGLLARRRQ